MLYFEYEHYLLMTKAGNTLLVIDLISYKTETKSAHRLLFSVVFVRSQPLTENFRSVISKSQIFFVLYIWRMGSGFESMTCLVPWVISGAILPKYIKNNLVWFSLFSGNDYYLLALFIVQALEYSKSDLKLVTQETFKAQDQGRNHYHEYGLQHSLRLPPSSPYDKFLRAAGC